jgi:hypothetical protein
MENLDDSILDIAKLAHSPLIAKRKSLVLQMFPNQSQNNEIGSISPMRTSLFSPTKKIKANLGVSSNKSSPLDSPAKKSPLSKFSCKFSSAITHSTWYSRISTEK